MIVLFLALPLLFPLPTALLGAAPLLGVLL